MKTVEGKIPYHLVPVESMEMFTRAMEYGARQYEPDDWRKGKGMPWTWLIGAILRHTFAVLAGENYDQKSKLPHMAHVMAGAAMLCYYLTNQRYYSNDDRFKGK